MRAVELVKVIKEVGRSQSVSRFDSSQRAVILGGKNNCNRHVSFHNFLVHPHFFLSRNEGVLPLESEVRVMFLNQIIIPSI